MIIQIRSIKNHLWTEIINGRNPITGKELKFPFCRLRKDNTILGACSHFYQTKCKVLSSWMSEITYKQGSNTRIYAQDFIKDW